VQQITRELSELRERVNLSAMTFTSCQMEMMKRIESLNGNVNSFSTALASRGLLTCSS
jgi:hypothetical protein